MRWERPLEHGGRLACYINETAYDLLSVLFVGDGAKRRPRRIIR
jgi:hypothetical protein